MQKILLLIVIGAKNLPTRLFILLIISFIFFTTFESSGQSSLGENLSNLHSKVVDNKLYNNIDYEIDRPRGMSVLISKDTIQIYLNEFSKEKFTKEIEPILLEIRKKCLPGNYISIVGFNLFSFHKELRIDNLNKTFHRLSRISNFKYEFYFLNEYISIEK